MNEKLFKELNSTAYNFCAKLLDTYQCMDWKCSWVAFLNYFAEIMDEEIENWKLEEIE